MSEELLSTDVNAHATHVQWCACELISEDMVRGTMVAVSHRAPTLLTFPSVGRVPRAIPEPKVSEAPEGWTKIHCLPHGGRVCVCVPVSAQGFQRHLIQLQSLKQRRSMSIYFKFAGGRSTLVSLLPTKTLANGGDTGTDHPSVPAVISNNWCLQLLLPLAVFHSGVDTATCSRL